MVYTSCKNMLDSEYAAADEFRRILWTRTMYYTKSYVKLSTTKYAVSVIFHRNLWGLREKGVPARGYGLPRRAEALLAMTEQ